MKKLLLSTAILIAFSFSVILFQISCKKEGKADTIINTVTQQGIIIYMQPDNTHQLIGIYTANYDGTGAKKIKILLPTPDLAISDKSLSISPDRKTIVFTVYSLTNTGTNDIYSCDLNGSNLKKVVSGTCVVAY